MEKLEKAKHISLIVFNSIWLLAAAFFYFGGLSFFLDYKGGEEVFFGWMMWGVFCSVVIIPFIYRFTRQSVKDSASEGARRFTISSTGISNHPFAGAVFGFVTGILLGVAAGPIVTPFFAIKAVATIVKNAVALKRGL